MTREECLQFLKNAPYGRIIYTHHALPAVYPVLFTLDGDLVMFDVERASPIADAAGAAVLAFYVDEVDMSRGLARSVTVIGHAHLVDDAHRLSIEPEVVTGFRTVIGVSPD